MRELFSKLDNTDGISHVVILEPAGPEDRAGQTPSTLDPSNHSAREVGLHRHTIEIARLSDHDYIAVLIGDSGPGQRKLVACIWPKYHVAVEVTPGHAVNKSLQRILRRAGRRFGGLEVESKPRRPRAENPPCANEPPAASSDDPTTAPSSPSPVDTTPSTGGSPEAQ